MIAETDRLLQIAGHERHHLPTNLQIGT